MTYRIETAVYDDVVVATVFVDEKEVAKTKVRGTEAEAVKYVENVFLKDLREKYGWDIVLPCDPEAKEHLTTIDNVKVYWYQKDGKPRYKPFKLEEAYDAEGNRLYTYDDDGYVVKTEPTKEVKPKPLEIVDGVSVYYYTLDKTPVFKPMSIADKNGVYGYTFEGTPLYGYDDNGNILYEQVIAKE